MNESKVTVRTYIRGLIDLAIKLVVKPVDFFQTMSKTGGLIDPLLFVIMTALFSVVLSAAKSSISYGAGIHDVGMLAIWLIIVPLIAVIMKIGRAHV